MRPRTELEKRVIGLSSALPALNPSQESYPKALFKKEGLTLKKRVFCKCCGGEFPDNGSKRQRCPHCGRLLKVSQSRVTSEQTDILTYDVITSYEGFMVARCFYVYRIWHRGNPTRYELKESWQIWIDGEGRETIIAHPRMMSIYCDAVDFNKPMSIRKRPRYYTGYNRFSMAGHWIYPHIKSTPLLRRNGFDGGFHGLEPIHTMEALLTDNTAEWLFKTKAYSVLEDYLLHGELRHAKSVKVALRHGYTFPDFNMWSDYVSLLEYFGKDTHSPKYICPENLRKEHDRLQHKKDLKEEAETLAKRIKKSRRSEGQYRRHWGSYLGICFGDGNITCHVLQSVKEFAEEGTFMHHCVFSNEYWRYKMHPHSLILSARDNDDNRLETVEVSLKTFRVVQSRGRLNETTPYHDEIVSLVERNMDKIRAVWKRTA